MILKVVLEGICKETMILWVLMKVYTIPCHDRGHINVVLVLQSGKYPLHILPSSFSEAYVASIDCACNIGNMNVEEDVDMLVEEGEVNVKIEKDIGIKDEKGEEEEEWEYIYIIEEDICIKEEDDIGIKEEVSLEDTV